MPPVVVPLSKLACPPLPPGGDGSAQLVLNSAAFLLAHWLSEVETLRWSAFVPRRLTEASLQRRDRRTHPFTSQPQQQGKAGEDVPEDYGLDFACEFGTVAYQRRW